MLCKVVQHPTEVAVDVKGLLGSLLNANVNKYAVTELDENTVPNTKPHNRDKSQEVPAVSVVSYYSCGQTFRSAPV